MRQAIRLAVLLTLATAVPAGVHAQYEGALPKTTSLPASTRAMALGDSYAMTSGHADVLFYHPAHLTSASGFGMGVQRWGPGGSSAAFSATFELFGASWGLGLRSAQYGVPDAATLVAPLGQDHFFELGGDPVSERTVTIGYAREIFGLVELGVAADLLDARIGSSTHGLTLFDVGIGRQAGPVRIGLTAHDIGDKAFVDYGVRPSRVVLGAGGYGRQLGPLDYGFAANVGIDAADELTWGAGIEIGYWPVIGRTFVARVGVQDVTEGSDASPLTTGFAFWADDLTVEWAFRPFSGADEGGTHRFEVRMR